MIVKAVGDVISLSGSLTENHWLTLKAAANLLLKRHPEGILIDCGALVHCTPDGAHTFRDAIQFIESHQARIILVNLPQDILETLQSVPGVRSCIVTAKNIDEARASLKLASLTRAPEEPQKSGAIVMLPLLKTVDAAYVHNACTVARNRGGKLYLVYVLEVPRALALSAPLAELEQEAKELLDAAEAMVLKEGLAPCKYMRRSREVPLGIIEAAQQLKADLMIVGIPPEAAGEYTHLIEALLKRAPCEVIINRTPPAASAATERETQRLG